MQRQLRLGDILDDYCPRERRLTNHAVVAMVGDDVKQTRCTTCDAEHEYKHARVPRQRKRDTPAALAAQIIASGPKRVPAEPSSAAESDDAIGSAAATEAQAAHDGSPSGDAGLDDIDREVAAMRAALGLRDDRDSGAGEDSGEGEGDANGDAAGGNVAGREPEGPAHRRLIRATLPRLDGQPPATRPAPEFTIRTPATGRPNRFRARNQHQRGPGGAPPFGGGRSGQPGNTRGGGAQRPGHSRPQANQSRRFDGRKRSK